MRQRILALTMLVLAGIAGWLATRTNPHYAEPVAGLPSRGTLLPLAGVLVALAGVCLAAALGARRRPAPAGFPAEPGAG